MKHFALFFLLISGLLAEPLKIVAYNIKHGEGMDGKIDLKRIAGVIAAEKPDVVTLQEVDNKCKRSGGVDQAAELGRLLKMEHRFGKFMDYQGGQYGMAVLSRLPIKKTQIHRLPKGAEPRIALEVVVEAAAWPGTLSVVSIHNDWITEEVRKTQIKALMRGLSDRKHPVILAGDFNAQPADASLALLSKAGWQTLRKGNKMTWPSLKPKVEIDYFISRGLPPFSFEEKVIAGKEASDHCPITLALTPAKKD